MAAQLRGRTRGLGSEIYQRLDCLWSDVVDHHGMTGPVDVAGNRAAYGTQTNEAN
jgi:hypothetical protein